MPGHKQMRAPSFKVDNGDLLETNDDALEDVVYSTFQRWGLLADGIVELGSLLKFIGGIDNMMCCSNAYHNLLHVTDVTQGQANLVQELQANWKHAGKPGFSWTQLLALAIAAPVHDLGHPGTSNVHQVARSKGTAAELPDGYPANEQLHVKAFLQLVEGCGLLDRLTAEDRAQVIDLVITMILYTDMSRHHELMKRFTDLKMARGGVRNMVTEADRNLLCCVLLHTADISNPAKPWRVARYMGEAVMQEVIEQYFLERELVQQGQISEGNLLQAPWITGMPASQIWFIDTFVEPLLEAVSDVLPKFYKESMVNLKQNKENWKVLQEAGVLLPGQELPEL